MAGVEKRTLDSPDETRNPERTTLEIVKLGDASVGRSTFEPGWRWSEHIKPVAGTESCQANHLGIVQSGSIHVVHEDGSEADLVAGDVYTIHPGHDAWVVGDTPFVGVEFNQATVATFGK